MVDPVEEQIDFMIDEIDNFISGRYAFKFRDILEHPLDFKDRPAIMVELEKMKDDITAFFDGRKAMLGDAVKNFERDATVASKLADEFSEIVKGEAKSNKKSIIHPLTYARREDQDEIIFVEKMEDSYEGAIEALVKNSLFVVDSTVDIDGFKVGRWLFPDASGKNRALFVSFPINPAGAMDIARDQMLVAVDAVKTEISSQNLLEEGTRPEEKESKKK